MPDRAFYLAQPAERRIELAAVAGANRITEEGLPSFAGYLGRGESFCVQQLRSSVIG
jgi:hypothetical protein